MTGGSTQLRAYRTLRRAGATMLTAAVEAGIGLHEARLIEADDAANPPPESAYEPLTPAPSSAPPEKEDDMARPRKAPAAAISGEIPKPDFALAVKIYRDDIKPAQSSVGEFAQEQSTAYKAIKKQAHIQPQAAKAAFAISEMEESKRDDYLRSLNGILKEMKIGITADLVDAAQGKTAEDVIPTAERPRPTLVTIPKSDGIDADLGPVEEPKAETDAGDADHAQAAE